MQNQPRFLRHCVLVLATLVSTQGDASSLFAQADSPEKQREIAGKADVLKQVPKTFATLVDVDRRQVVLLVEGEDQPQIWPVNPDAELKRHGWWARLDQFPIGDRVWVWFSVNRDKQPQSVLMLADEISEQDIHDLPCELESYDADERIVTVTSKISGRRQLNVPKDVNVADRVGERVYVQTAGEELRTVVLVTELELLRSRQQEYLREQWRQQGLPGTVTFLHPLGGEMELMLDHEAIRWGRYLANGDEVTIHLAKPMPSATDVSAPTGEPAPISAFVKQVTPWRERTSLRLVTESGLDQADLSIGLRVKLQTPEPPQEIQALELPTDIGRRTSSQERINWFLASTYCSCKIAGDRCTGMFYTLASCNVNACGMPNLIRGKVAEMIEQEMTDEQIWRKLQELRGPMVVKPHLLH